MTRPFPTSIKEATAAVITYGCGRDNNKSHNSWAFANLPAQMVHLNKYSLVVGHPIAQVPEHEMTMAAQRHEVVVVQLSRRIDMNGNHVVNVRRGLIAAGKTVRMGLEPLIPDR
jgi:hypothetical protein